MTFVALNWNMLCNLIIFLFRSKLWTKSIIFRRIFILLLSQKSMSQIYWKKRSFSRHLLILNEKLFLLLLILNEKLFILSEYRIYCHTRKIVTKSLMIISLVFIALEKTLFLYFFFQMIKIDSVLAQILQNMFW